MISQLYILETLAIYCLIHAMATDLKPLIIVDRRRCGGKLSRELLKKHPPTTKKKKQQYNKMANREIITLGAGILMVTFGIFMVFTWESILENQVNKEFILTEHSKTYESWIKTRINVYLKFYFWNWTNPHNYRDPDYKPILTEMGPYVYKEVTQKVDVVWNSNGTVSYRRMRHWYFKPELSQGREDDLVTNLNVVAKSAAFITRHSNYVTKISINVGLTSTQSMHVTKTVKELLFDGYRNQIIDTAQHLPSFANINIPFDRFGWFYKRNGSAVSDGVFNVETGINGMENFGVVRSWNYGTQTPFYDGECGAVRGSAGDFFPPKRTKQDKLVFFTPDLCRAVSFVFENEEDRYGMTAYKYALNAELLDNGAGDPTNTCFCGGECPPAGALNVSTCRLGAPAFVSFPHFLGADSSYSEAVVGMKPDPKLHSSYFLIEPRYGVPLDIAAKFQINILVQSYPHITMYSNLKTTYFPVMWFEQGAVVPEETVKAVKMLLALPTVGLCVAAILIVVGSALMITAISLKYCRTKKLLEINKAENVTDSMIKEETKTEEKSEIEIIKYDTKL